MVLLRLLKDSLNVIDVNPVNATVLGICETSSWYKSTDLTQIIAKSQTPIIWRT